MFRTRVSKATIAVDDPRLPWYNLAASYETGYMEGWQGFSDQPGLYNVVAYMMGWEDGRGDQSRWLEDHK